MKKYNIILRKYLALMTSLFFITTLYAANDLPERSFDGLVLKKGSKADTVYALPDVDLSIYNKVIILEPQIAFVKNWKRDQNRSRSMSNRVKDKDIERMISRGKDLFEHIFTDVLEEGGYPVVHEAGENVLLVKPAIIDLNVTAPDIQTAGRSRTYVASAGSATLYIELYDSVSGQRLVRAFDKRKSRDRNISWSIPSSSVTNKSAATRGLTYWAGLLKEALDNAKNSKR
ncbi:MAG: DUF3313 family protein [Pseudomonadales bacterium]